MYSTFCACFRADDDDLFDFADDDLVALALLPWTVHH
jgi:hypothetical protein